MELEEIDNGSASDFNATMFIGLLWISLSSLVIFGAIISFAKETILFESE